MATVLSCSGELSGTVPSPQIMPMERAGSRGKRKMETFIAKKADTKLVEKQSAKKPCESKVVHSVSQRLELLLHVKTLHLMLQLVQIFIVCMTMGLQMLNPLLLFSHDDLTMALLLCIQEVMQSKYSQFSYIIHQLHNVLSLLLTLLVLCLLTHLR